MRWATVLNAPKGSVNDDSCDPEECLFAQVVAVRLALIHGRSLQLDEDDWQVLLGWLDIGVPEASAGQQRFSVFHEALSHWLSHNTKTLNKQKDIDCLLAIASQRVARLLHLDEVEHDILVLAWLALRHQPLRTVLVGIEASQSAKTLSLLLGHPANAVHQASQQEPNRLKSLGILGKGKSHFMDMDDVLGAGYLLEQLAPLLAQHLDFRCEGALDQMLHERLLELCPRLSKGDFSLASFSQVPLRQLIRDYLHHALAQGQRGANVLIYGKPGVGKTEFVKSLATQLGAELYGVPVAEKDQQPLSPHSRLGRFQVVQQLLAKRQDALVMFDEIEDVLNGSSALPKGWTNQLLEDNSTPSLWVSNSIHWLDQAYLRRFDLIVEVQTVTGLNAKRQHRELLAALPVTTAARDTLATQSWMTPAMATQLNRLAPLLDTKAPLRNQQHLDQVIQARLKAQGVTDGNAFSRLNNDKQIPAMPPYDMAWLHTRPGLNQIITRLQRRQRGRLCLHGLPGSGKTALAAHVAKTLDRELITAHASSLLDAFVGGTEQKIADVFALAREKNAVLLLDEVDSLLMNRDSAHQRWEISQTNELLVQLDTFDGILLATTNRVESLDRAVMRRFDLKVGFLPLQPDQLRNLLQQVLPSRDHARLAAIPHRHLAHRQLTPGNVRTALDQLDMRGLPIRLNQLMDALALEEQEQHGKRRGIGFLG